MHLPGCATSCSSPTAGTPTRPGCCLSPARSPMPGSRCRCWGPVRAPGTRWSGCPRSVGVATTPAQTSKRCPRSSSRRPSRWRARWPRRASSCLRSAAPSPVTDGFTHAPALFGYVLTKAKATASTALEVGPADPLLSTWQRGLGRVTAWTSDATTRWSSAWVEWDGYVTFWGDVLRQVLPAGLDTPPEVTATGGTAPSLVRCR